MKKLLLILVAVFAVSFAANANSYTLDDAAIDALVENSVEVSPVLDLATLPAPLAANLPAVGSPSPVGAFLLCFFLGGFGVHRHYLGTRPGMWAIYTFTFGGIFGIVPFVDWIMLLIGLVDDNISPYVGNTKFFMWA